MAIIDTSTLQLFPETPSKKCSACKVLKPLSAFHRQTRSSDGYCSCCKICRIKQSRQYYHDNISQITPKQRAYYDKNKDRILEYSRQYHAERAPEPQWAKIAEQVSTIAEVHMAYIAGLIDGEGSLGIIKHKRGNWTPTITIAVTHEEVIQWVACLFSIKYTIKKPRNPLRHRPQYVVRISGYRAYVLCQRLLPFMHIKKPHTEVFIRFGTTYLSRRTPQSITDPNINIVREAMHHELKTLNARLVPSNGITAQRKIRRNVAV